MRTHWQRPVAVSALRRFPAGMSWITIGFTATVGQGFGKLDRRELILRIGDPGGLLAPYRAEPEFIALTALSGLAGLPVPGAVAFSDDASVLGAPFLVTAHVQGDAPMPWKGADADRHGAATRSLGEDFVDALAAIHSFAWRASAMAALSPSLAGDVALDQVARGQLRRWSAHAGVPSPAAPPQMHYAMRWLDANAPVADRITLVHGDYRVGNFLQRGGRITAILDWELMHFGDPHEDLAWAGLRTFSAGTGRIGGLLEREQFYERYGAGTGFRVRPEVVRYYEVLSQYKMAGLLIGAVRRVESAEARDVRMGAMGFQLAPTLLEMNRMIAAAA